MRISSFLEDWHKNHIYEKIHSCRNSVFTYGKLILLHDPKSQLSYMEDKCEELAKVGAETILLYISRVTLLLPVYVHVALAYLSFFENYK